MKKIFFSCLSVLCTIAYGQDSSHNFDFEKTDSTAFVSWQIFGNEEYKLTIEKEFAYSGSTSAGIESADVEGGFKALSYNIPAIYEGKRIKLTGYIKTENVTDGYAGLWMRIDPRLGFDNMQNRGITGTTDWTAYEIELDLKAMSAKNIYVGALLSGKGKMWVDRIDVTIDGKPLEEVPLRQPAPAESDKEFDNGSGIDISTEMLNGALSDDLVLLGKVWGFLKYHHPSLSKGDYNWDYELFRFMPGYLNIAANQRPASLLKWIEQYGEVATCSSCQPTAANAFLKPDLGWIEAIDDQALKNKLQFIYQNRHQGDHYYIAMAPGVGNPEFKNEAAYANMPYPDAGFRLLALYKYWNMIHYFFPYKNLIDKDWNHVLAEYLPAFIGAEDELAYELAAIGIIGDIKDTHANLWGGGNKVREWKGEKYPPVRVKFIEDQLVITDFFNEEHKTSLGLSVGDVITHIKDRPVGEIVEERVPYYPASNQPTRLRDIAIDILRSNDSSVAITYRNSGDSKNMDLPVFKREELNYYGWYRNDPDGKSFKKLSDDIGYVTLKNIKSEDIPKIKEEFADTRGIVIDIRNYPSTFVPFLLGGFFLSEPTEFVKFTGGNVNNPGEFNFGPALKIPGQANAYKGKVVVLVNELSQSQAEYTTMAFRANSNATVIGSTTAGADGNVSSFLMPGGLRTMISGIGVYYPNGDETQRVGIVPDIEVLPTVKGIREGRDELLEKAIEVINSTNLDKTKN